MQTQAHTDTCKDTHTHCLKFTCLLALMMKGLATTGMMGDNGVKPLQVGKFIIFPSNHTDHKPSIQRFTVVARKKQLHLRKFAQTNATPRKPARSVANLRYEIRHIVPKWNAETAPPTLVRRTLFVMRFAGNNIQIGDHRCPGLLKDVHHRDKLLKVRICEAKRSKIVADENSIRLPLVYNPFTTHACLKLHVFMLLTRQYLTVEI